MAEAHEQPALLHQDVDEVKKPGRSKSSARPRRTPATKTGSRSVGKQTKAEEKVHHIGANNGVTVLEGQNDLPEKGAEVAPEIVTGQPVEIVEVAAEPDDRSRTDVNESIDEPVVADAAPVRSREAAQIVEVPRYDPVFGEGLIEVSGKGFGFLRDPKRNYVQSPQDIFVTPEVVRKHALRDGLWIKGEVRRGSRGPQLFRLVLINGEDPDKYRNLPVFEELTSINPIERILLVDERPEEVTEIRRTVPKGDIMASSNDSDIKSHTRIAQLAIERAKRLVEAGKDVFVLMDSLTRVGRAFNNAISGSGRTMSGGMDSRAMEIPRKLFAAARNTEEAGSLTIMATALIETGSKMDELIFQEFKGTGNMEMVLDRQISDQRIYPAIDIFKSGTRREELLLPVHDLEKINTIRRGLAGHRPPEAIERLLSFLKKFPTNSQMLREIPG